MRTYRVLRPLKNRGRWISIGSIIELDVEEGKALESSGIVLELNILTRTGQAPEYAAINPFAPERQELKEEKLTAADDNPIPPVKKGGRPPSRKK